MDHVPFAVVLLIGPRRAWTASMIGRTSSANDARAPALAPRLTMAGEF